MAKWTITFDLDDTLVPEHGFQESGFRSVARHLAARSASRHSPAGSAEDAAYNALRDAYQADSGHAFDGALERLGLPATREHVTELVTLYREHYPADLKLFPDAKRVLDRLLAATEPPRLAIITDGFSVTQQQKLQAMGVADLFDPVICTFDLDQSWRKPSPRAFQEIVDQHHSDEYVYIGDNPSKDFGGPAELGWHTVYIRRPGGVHASVQAAAHRIDHSLDSLDSLCALLELPV